ncbi:MAG: hypothetical protein V4506_14755 [Bacteroidota bacterium]
MNLLLIFEQPPVKPKLFTQEAEAHQWLKQQVNARYEKLLNQV